MPLANKLSLAALSSVLVLIGTIISGWLFLDDRYAHAGNVSQQLSNQQITVQLQIIAIDIRSLNAQLSWLNSKATAGQLISSDSKYMQYLEQELDRLYSEQSQLMQLRHNNQ